MIIKCAA